jgi:MoaA/NifB/PqqE/SkfB family radical SAM enzyme
MRKLARRFVEPLAYAFDLPLVKPGNVSLSLTNRCNLRCPTCAYWKTPDGEKTEELTLDELRHLLRRLREWLGPFQIGLTGGEPFLRPDVFDVIRECAALGIRVATVTNGSLFPPRRVEELLEIASRADNPIEVISLSLNHLDPVKHNSTRGVENSAQKILEAIGQLNQPGRRFRLTLSTILMGYNLDHAPDMVRWVSSHGLDGITFQILYFESGNDGYAPGWYRQSPFWDSDHDKIDRGIDELARMKRSGLPVANTVEQLEWMRRYLMDPEAPIDIPCRVGVANFDIEPNGDVCLCDVMAPVGNVRVLHPRDLWQGGIARQRRVEIHRCDKACRIKTCNFRKPLTAIASEQLSRIIR